MTLVEIRNKRKALREELDKIEARSLEDIDDAAMERIDAIPVEDAKLRKLEETLEARAAERAEPAEDTLDDAIEYHEGLHAVRDRDADRKYGNFGEYLVDVRTAATSRQEPKRLIAHQEREARALGLSEGVPSDGGFLVGKDDVGGILQHMFTSGQVLNRVRKISVGPNSNGIRMNGIDETSRANGSRWGGVQAYWENEAGATTKSKPKFKKLNIDLEKVMALYYATDEVLQDTSVLGQVASQAFGDEIRFKVEDAIINGDGAAKPLGVLSSAALVSVTRTTSSEIKSEDIFNMWMRLKANHRSNAVWFINQDCERELFEMVVTDGTVGGTVYIPSGGLSASPFGQLMGRPVVPIEFCATKGTVGDVILADLSQYILIDKGGIQEASSAHVQFLTDEMVFRFTYRVNGQPLWNSALTPFKGSDTQSPFVAIAS